MPQTVAVVVDSQVLPELTVPVLGGSGGTPSPLTGLLLGLVRPQVTVVVDGVAAYSAAPYGDPSGFNWFPVLLFFALVGVGFAVWKATDVL